MLELYYLRAHRMQRIVREIDFISCFAPITRALNTYIALTLLRVTLRAAIISIALLRQPLRLMRLIKNDAPSIAV